MGRPLKFDREAALDAAMNAFWRNGYEACSVKALSEMLGITRSSFYNAFGDRETLFREVLARYLEHCPDHALMQAGTTGGVRALITRTLREVCRIRAADAESRGCLAVNSIAELAGTDGDLAGFLEQALLGSLACLEQLLRHAQDLGEIPASADPRALALSLKTLLMGLNVLSKVVRDEDELWLAARTSLEGLGLLDD